MNFALFGRFFLEFAMMYPAEYLCLASLQEHLRAPRKTYAIGASAITLMGLAGAAVCCMLDIETNFLLIPLLIISFWLLRWRTDREVSISQTMFLLRPRNSKLASSIWSVFFGSQRLPLKRATV